MLRRRGQAQFDKLFAKPDHRRPNILNRAGGVHGDQQRLGMAFKNRHTRTGRTHQKIGECNGPIFEGSKNFMPFLFDFFLFAGNERNNVVYGVHADHTRRATSPG